MKVAVRTLKGSMRVGDPITPLVKALTGVRPVDTRFRFTCNTRIASQFQANLLSAACTRFLCTYMVF